MLLMIICLLSVDRCCTDAFLIGTTLTTPVPSSSSPPSRMTTSLNGLFGSNKAGKMSSSAGSSSAGKGFGSNTSSEGAAASKESSSSSSSTSGVGNSDTTGTGPSTPTTDSKLLFEIPAKEVKSGALRFIIQMYLVGLQKDGSGNSSPNTWLPRQGEGDGKDHMLEVYYGDGTGMCAIDFQSTGIVITRHGSRPSLQYVLQESIMLHGILDELDGIALGQVLDEQGQLNENETIEFDKRLLQLIDDDAISKARETLPARKE